MCKFKVKKFTFAVDLNLCQLQIVLILNNIDLPAGMSITINWVDSVSRHEVDCTTEVSSFGSWVVVQVHLSSVNIFLAAAER